MARLLYGNSPADFTLTTAGKVIAGAELTVWTEMVGGTQVTDLLDHDNVACTVVTSDSAGLVRFYGPDGTDSTLWLDSGSGSRLLVRPVNLPQPDIEIGTVTTGAAAATITGGGQDAYTLDFVLPAAGTSSITSDMLVNGTIVNADINAAAAIDRSKISGMPTSSIDNTLPRFDSTAGALQTSGIVVDDNNRLTVPTGSAAGYGFVSGALRLSGTGAPESTVTAPPGSTWQQTDSTTTDSGVLLWHKKSGTGSTGWVPGPFAATGWRLIPYTDGAANWTAGNLYVRRKNDIVAVIADNIGMSAITTIYSLPTGFQTTLNRPASTILREGASVGLPYWFAINAASVCCWGAALSGTFSASYRFSGQFTFMTNDVWPSSLPGSAV